MGGGAGRKGSGKRVRLVRFGRVAHLEGREEEEEPEPSATSCGARAEPVDLRGLPRARGWQPGGQKYLPEPPRFRPLPWQ